MTDNRQNNLLKAIVEEYVRSASPVGSGLIADKYFKDLSSATVRNDMAELERQGLICQPHTSAGRLPTVAGYRQYLKYFVSDGEISAREKTGLDRVRLNDLRRGIKDIAKVIADLADNAAFASFGRNELFYTGISNLFRQPEFREQAYLYTMSEVIDHLDEAVNRVANRLTAGQIDTLIGADNPFGEMAAVIVTRYDLGGHSGLIGILGPQRLDYRQGLGLVGYARKCLTNNH